MAKGSRTEVVGEAMEDALPSARLGKVRVHIGGNVAELVKGLGARAFTPLNHVHFAKPSDAKGAGLVAHELWHVIQQRNGKPRIEQKGQVLT